MQDPSTPKKPLLNKHLKLFLFAMILANLGGNMYGMLMPLYLQDLGADITQIGLFFTLASMFPLMFQILGGWISDTIGRLRSIAFGSIAGAIGIVGLVIAPSWEWVLLAEGVNAITRSLVGPSFGAFIADQSSEENRARVFGITESIFSIVSVLGPPIGGILARYCGFKVMLAVAAAFYIGATIIRISMARVAAQGKESQPRALSMASLGINLKSMWLLIVSGGVLTWLLLTDGIRDIAFTMSFNLMPVYLKDFGMLKEDQIGALGSLMGICTMAITIPAGWLADKKGERVAIALGYIIITMALIVFLQANSFWLFALSWILFGLGSGMLSPAYSSLTTKAVPENLRGTAMGLLHTSLGIFSLPAPAIGAFLWQKIHPLFPFGITAIASIITIIPVWIKFRLPTNGSTNNKETISK
jgi:DHA1 family multidrug resistance protein-like MFS transporter